MYIGVDVRDTKIAVGLVDDRGQLSLQSTLPVDTKRGSETVILDIIYIIKSISESVPFNLFNDRVIGIGIGIQGNIDKSTGKIVDCANPALENVALKDIIQRHFDIPVVAESHEAAVSLAEKEVGSLKESEAGIVAAGMLCKYLQ